MRNLFYKADESRIRDIIVSAAKNDVTFNSSQAFGFAIRNCRLTQASAADFKANVNEDGRRRHTL